MEQFLATIAVENVAYHFDILYTYTVPENLIDIVKKGSRVMVPFGRSKSAKRQGVVFEIKKGVADKGTKSILSCLDETPFISDEALEIALFLKDRTFCTLYEAVKVQMPSGISFKTTVKYYAVASDFSEKLKGVEKEVYDYMMTLDSPFEKNQIYISLGIDSGSDIIDTLVNKKLVVKVYEAKQKIKDANIKTARLIMTDEQIESLGKLSVKQKSVIEVLKVSGQSSVKEICYFTGVTMTVLKTLDKKGIIEFFDNFYYRTPDTIFTANESKNIINLTAVQLKAYEDIINSYNGGGGVNLLYGITGSGKTSVFLSVIDRVVSDNKQVIVMVHN